MEFGIQVFPRRRTAAQGAGTSISTSAWRWSIWSIAWVTAMSGSSSIISTITVAIARIRPCFWPRRRNAPAPPDWSPGRCCRCSTTRQAGRRARDAGCDLQRPARGRLRARLPAPRICPLRDRREYQPGPVRGGHGAGPPAARRRQGGDDRAVPQLPETTSLPRPTQKPRPPFWVAALATAESFVKAGQAGYGIMAIPMGGAQLAELIGQYREAWRSAGHPGDGRVMLAFHMLCAETQADAEAVARAPLKRLSREPGGGSRRLAHRHELEGIIPNYDKMIAGLKAETFESQLAKNAAWVGTPETIRDQIVDSSAWPDGSRPPRCRSISTPCRSRRRRARWLCSPSV